MVVLPEVMLSLNVLKNGSKNRQHVLHEFDNWCWVALALSDPVQRCFVWFSLRKS